MPQHGSGGAEESDGGGSSGCQPGPAPELNEDGDNMELSAGHAHVLLLGDDYLAAESLIKRASRENRQAMKGVVAEMKVKIGATIHKLHHETHAKLKMACAQKYPDVRAILQLVDDHLGHIEKTTGTGTKIFEDEQDKFLRSFTKTAATGMANILSEISAKMRGIKDSEKSPRGNELELEKRLAGAMETLAANKTELESMHDKLAEETTRRQEVEVMIRQVQRETAEQLELTTKGLNMWKKEYAHATADLCDAEDKLDIMADELIYWQGKDWTRRTEVSHLSGDLKTGVLVGGFQSKLKVPPRPPVLFSMQQKAAPTSRSHNIAQSHSADERASDHAGVWPSCAEQDAVNTSGLMGDQQFLCYPAASSLPRERQQLYHPRPACSRAGTFSSGLGSHMH